LRRFPQKRRERGDVRKALRDVSILSSRRKKGENYGGRKLGCDLSYQDQSGGKLLCGQKKMGTQRREEIVNQEGGQFRGELNHLKEKSCMVEGSKECQQNSNNFLE